MPFLILCLLLQQRAKNSIETPPVRLAHAPQIMITSVMIGAMTSEAPPGSSPPTASARLSASPCARMVATMTVWLLAALATGVSTAQTAPAPAQLSVQPMFGSLKTDQVAVRNRPQADAPVSFVFRRAGMPVLVLTEQPNWRQVRDWEGTTGWVPADLVSLRRTAIIARGGEANGAAALRVSDRTDADPRALLETGVIVGIIGCDGRWCRVSTSGLRGFIEQQNLWGVAETEIVR